ncbi:MAG: beta-galactosidase [Clostridia bacterium]|nr:beta-galactosidase [Clostridia bacterium]
MKENTVWAYWGHEPSYHLKRMHTRPSLFTLGEWSDKWQDRLRTEECIKKAADDGINIIYTNYFKGFGLEYEKEEIEKTKILTEIAHKYNIKVLGYCQLDSIYYETFLAEDSNAKKMAALKPDGTFQIWGDSYYRWSVCYNSKEFTDYIKKVVDYGLSYVGLDGFHFDNSYIGYCYCERCKKDFRKYLEENEKNPKDILGINTFDYIEIPYYEAFPKINHDSLYFLWQKYRQVKCSEVQNEIFAYVKEKSDNKAIILHNPAFPRGSADYLNFGFNPELAGNQCDFILAENHDNLINENGKVTTQIMAYKFGERFKYKVFESSWTIDEEKKDYPAPDCYTYPKTYFQIAYFLSQSMIYGGLTGTPWLMRSTHNGDELLQDFPLQRETHKKIISYYHDNYKLYDGKPLNYVKVLYSPDNLINMSSSGLDSLKNTVNLIHNENIHFSFVTVDEIPSLSKDQILVLPEVFFADDALCKNLSVAANNGCKIIQTGKFNECNIYGKAKDKTSETNKISDIIRVENDEEIIVKIKAYLTSYINISCQNIVSEVTTDNEGNMLLHLLSTKDRDHENVDIELIGMGNIKNVELYSFENVEFQNDNTTITLNNFKTMATLKIIRED